MGDFNYPQLDWELETSQQKNLKHDSHVFMKTLLHTFWKQHVKHPTRARLRNENGLLDLVITNEEEMMEELSHTSPLGKSDHSILEFRIIINIDKTESHQVKYVYNKGDYESMRTFLTKD